MKNMNSVYQEQDFNSESSKHLDLARYETYPSKIGLTDEELVNISTKALNNLLKKSNINAEEKEGIKIRRRTLKNRGYAAETRNQREEAEKALDKDLTNFEVKLSGLY